MVAALFAAMIFALPALAGTEHWTAAGGDLNWTTSGNWTGINPPQTYFNDVDFIDNGGTTNLNDFSVNTIFPSATGVSQCPIYMLRMYPTNRNFTTLINPGVALYTGAGTGDLYAGGDQITAARGLPNIHETITFEGTGALLAITGTLHVGQGLSGSQTSPASSQYVTLDLSGLDNFAMMPNINGGTQIQGISVGNTASGTAGSRFLLCGQSRNYSQGAIYLAKTNIIVLGNDMEIGAMSTFSNSMPCPVYLGMSNSILVGNNGAANGLVTIGSRGNTNAFMTFNPAFLGGATPPVASFASPPAINGGRVTTFYVCRSDGGVIPAYGYADYTGGSVTIMASTMHIGYAGNSGLNALGVLTLDNGVVNVNTLNVGNQTVTSGGKGVGIINLNSNSTYLANAILQVNNTLTLGAVTGTLAPGTAGTININGGALTAGTIVNGLGSGTINLTSGSLTVTGTAGTPAAPINNVSITNSTLQFAVIPNTTNAVVTSLATGGANTINITAAPPLNNVPVVLKLISYSGSIGGAGYNFTLGTLPPLCAGYLSNDTANASVDFVLTSAPLGLTWDGDVSGNWDTTTTNWFAAGPNFYADGDYVTFPNAAATGAINLTATFAPGGVTVSNTSLTYTFSGGGAIGGSGGLVKQGTGTPIKDTTANPRYRGVTPTRRGTVQIGNGDASGNLPGNIVTNGTLAFDRTENLRMTNAISGTVSFTEACVNTLQLKGANNFSGGVTVTNDSTLQLGGGSATGTAAGGLTIANGSTLDMNGNTVAKNLFISGTGVGGTGALTDNGGSVYDNPGPGVSSNITLTGDTTFSFPVRWDLGSAAGGNVLGTGGNPYNLTLAGGNGVYFEWRNLSLDTNLANITVASGNLGVVGSTTFGNPGSTLTLSPNAAITMYNASVNVFINKQVDFQNGASINTGGGNDVMNGAMTLEAGFCTFNIGGGTSLTLSNVLSGSGVLYDNGGTGTLNLNGNSPLFTGGVLLYTGQLTLNGSIGSGITSLSGTTVSGTGTANGLVDVSGTLLPGGSGVAGTLTTGGLTLEGSSTLTMDLSAANTVGSGVNDLIVVNGDLNANGNTLFINPIGATLANSYTLLTYTGNAPSFFGGASTVAASRYVFTLTNVTTTTPKQVNLLVSGSGGGPASLVWNNASGTGSWDTQISQNWSNQTTHAAADFFFTQDSVTFDDSIASSATPTTSITIPTLVIPNVMSNNSTTNYTINGPGKISGGASIVKLGSSTLTIDSTNDFTGNVTIAGGTLKTGVDSALGSSSGTVYVTNGGTLDLIYSLGNQPLVISGAGVGGLGALVNNDSSGTPIYDNPGGLLNIRLAGNATIGGANRMDFGQISPASGVISSGGSNYSLTVVGTTYREWDNVAFDANFGNINVMTTGGGTVGIKGTTTLGNPASSLAVFSNAAVVLYEDSGSLANVTVNKTLMLYGGSTFQNGGGANLILSPIVLGVASGDACNLSIGGNSLTASNIISGPGNLVLNDSSPFLLTATNTYTGSTLLTSGTLYLTNNGSISGSTNINLASGTSLDVSGRTDKTLTLAGTQTLSGIGTVRGSLTASAGSTVSPGISGTGTLTVTNAVTLQGNAAFSFGAAFNNTLAAPTIGYGGTLSLSFTPGSLVAGNSFKLFNAVSYSGSFAALSPTSPGAGLAWDTSQLTVSGKLNVISGASPRIGHISLTGTNLSITGTGGPDNGTFHVLSSTNAATKVSTWPVFGSGSFDSSGNFTFNAGINPADPQRYFAIVEP